MKNYIVKKCFSLLLVLTLAFSVVAIVPNDDYSIISPASILKDNEPKV